MRALRAWFRRKLSVMWWAPRWAHRPLGHTQTVGSFFDTPDWSQPVYCSCGKEWRR